MKAVTAGALLFAGVSCTGDDDDTSNDGGWNVQEGDAGADADGDADSPGFCSGGERTGDCHVMCSIDEDIDCCEQAGHCWQGGQCYEDACAVPGPFVPPKMMT